jgi:nucleolar GTP-binding protein
MTRQRGLPACQAVLEAQAIAASQEKKKLERDLENENGGAVVYFASLKKHYTLTNDAWKEDILPEILDGDFPYPDILERCDELEKGRGSSC